MPSFRAQFEVLGLKPRHRPPEVEEALVGAVAENFHVDARDLDVIAGTPRVTVRFTVPDTAPDEEVELAQMAKRAALEAVDPIASIGRVWLLVRSGGRWIGVDQG